MTQDLFKSVTSQWVAPTEFPHIEGRIAIDLETKDPDLLKKGSLISLQHLYHSSPQFRSNRKQRPSSQICI